MEESRGGKEAELVGHLLDKVPTGRAWATLFNLALLN